MLRISRAVVATFTLGVAAVITAAQAAEPVERMLYTRADVLTLVTGEVSLRRAYTRQLELPSTVCEGRPFTCVVKRVYGQVYSIAFVEETVSRGADGKATIDRRDRGRLTVALELSKEAENRLEDALITHINQLDVAAFARPQAGVRYLDGPLIQTTLAQSKAPVWVCAELGDTYNADVLISDGAEVLRTYSAGGDSKVGCPTIEESVHDVAPTIFRTMPDTRAQLRHEVRLSSVSTLKGLTWANHLVSIPEGATLKKGLLNGDQKTGGMRDVRDGAFVGHEGRYGAVEQDVRLPRASVDLSGAPMWITRWTFDATRERFGEEPKSEHDATTSLLVAVAPLADPLMNDLDRGTTELSVPDDRVIAAAVARFVGSAALGPTLVADALTDPEIWPSRGEWVVVTCRDDGSARYGIAPFAEAAEVANPREACAAIRRELGK